MEILYFLKYMLEISHRNKDKITVKYRKGVIFKMSKLRLRNDFLQNEIPQQKIPEQLHSWSLALNLKWNALTACNSTCIFNWLTSFHIFHSCTILVYSIGHTEFLLHLGHFQRCNLGKIVWYTQVQTGSQGLYFSCCSIFQRNFPNFGLEILALRSTKSFRGLYFY